jgi:hypothetical protein
MAGRTERLKVVAIEEQRRVSCMRLDVVDLELVLHLPTLRTGIRLLEEHLPSEMKPADLPVPAAQGVVTTGVFLLGRMRSAASTGNEHATPWLGAISHRSSTINASCR